MNALKFLVQLSKKTGSCFLQSLSGSFQQCRLASYRIACASGFWGDSAMSTRQLIHSDPPVNVIAYDYLAEVTMSILAATKSNDPGLGYCPDLYSVHLAPNLKEIEKQKIKIVSNAGGLNPLACARQIQDMAAQQQLQLNVAAITGDDLCFLNLDQLKLKMGKSDTELPNEVKSQGFSSVNVYFGAKAISRALDLGADIVVTGRCVDSALVLGPLAHRFKWNFAQDFDSLATGSLAGHLIECGTQCTGGMFTDWHTVSGWDNIGFPIVEFDDSTNRNEFVLTKPADTGGLVNVGTAAEQLVYEISDPASYLLPDVCADFSNVTIDSVPGRKNAVRVSGAVGWGRPDKYKVTGTYMSGYRCTAIVPIMGPNPVAKAEKSARALLDRCGRMLKAANMDGEWRKICVRVLGPHDCQGQLVDGCAEAALWLSVRHGDRRALQLLSRELASASTGMAPGFTTLPGGRPKVSAVLMHCGFAWPREDVKADIYMNGDLAETVIDDTTVQMGQRDRKGKRKRKGQEGPEEEAAVFCGNETLSLSSLAFARSGDKGDTANIGVICRDAKNFGLLKHRLTAQVVADYFKAYMENPRLVVRYELPGIKALNFVLPKSLGGGGMASLRVDPQGKGYAQLLLDMKLEGVPGDLLKR